MAVERCILPPHTNVPLAQAIATVVVGLYVILHLRSPQPGGATTSAIRNGCFTIQPGGWTDGSDTASIKQTYIFHSTKYSRCTFILD